MSIEELPPSADLPPPDSTSPRSASASRLKARQDKEQRILAEAERQFAQFGFEGTSLENIAAAVGISRHNLLYNFPSKEALYRRVLDDVLMQWLAGLDAISRHHDPEQALREYIAAKLQSSRERPNGTKMFTLEVIAGAPRYADVIAREVAPRLQTEVATLERWADEGRIARLNFTHLLFTLWSATQAYADLGPQFALLLGKPALDAEDFDQARELITGLVLKGLGLPTGDRLSAADRPST
ncbi:MAG: TetR family transcriptional regulator C-terminal domain-containing protein [Curvibacter sp.]|nr:TetR family transcriptional regulator C-terminal domain-containing protein [Curvibacter sp.]